MFHFDLIMGSYREEAQPGERERKNEAKRKLAIQVEVNKREGAFSGGWRKRVHDAGSQSAPP